MNRFLPIMFWCPRPEGVSIDHWANQWSFKHRSWTNRNIAIGPCWKLQRSETSTKGVLELWGRPFAALTVQNYQPEFPVTTFYHMMFWGSMLWANSPIHIWMAVLQTTSHKLGANQAPHVDTIFDTIYFYQLKQKHNNPISIRLVAITFPSPHGRCSGDAWACSGASRGTFVFTSGVGSLVVAAELPFEST